MKNKTKILRIIHTLNPEFGGPQNAILDSSLALRKKGFKVSILPEEVSKLSRQSQADLRWRFRRDPRLEKGRSNREARVDRGNRQAPRHHGAFGGHQSGTG